MPTLRGVKFEAEAEVLPAARDALPRAIQKTATSVLDVGAQTLATSFKTFLEEFAEVLGASPDRIGRFTIDEVELALTVSGSGDFRIASAGADASIKLTLRRLRDGDSG
jgi:hypothetical protein